MLRFALWRWAVFPLCTVSRRAAGNSPPLAQQLPPFSVVQRPVLQCLQSLLFFTPGLNIDLNSFVSYWSATPPSAALNKTQGHTPAPFPYRLCHCTCPHCKNKKIQSQTWDAFANKIDVIMKGVYLSFLLHWRSLSSRIIQAKDIQRNLDLVLIQDLRSEMKTQAAWAGTSGQHNYSRSSFLSFVLTSVTAIWGFLLARNSQNRDGICHEVHVVAPLYIDRFSFTW